MLEPERGDRFRDAPWFIPLDGARLPLGYGTKAATPGANITQEHESGGAVIPALPNIGTLSRLAYRV
jgi:hypothetical protein